MPALSKVKHGKYFADPEDLDKVSEFAKSMGLTVKEINSTRRTVKVSGTVKQMNKAFAVKLGRYRSPEETYRGREGFVSLPKSIADLVEGVFGLDNRRMAKRASAPARSTGLTPPQVAKLYNFPNPSNASGQTIGLLEFGGGYKVGANGNPTDVQAFLNGLGLTTPKVTAVAVDGVQNAPTGDPNGDDGEVALDIEVASAVAQGASIAVYFAPWTEQGWVDIISTAIHPATGQPAPSVLSISWGWAEEEKANGLKWTEAAISAIDGLFSEAAGLGITVLAASGDDGSDCGIRDGLAHVLYPASDPWVTACGGTRISNISGASFTEDTWNDSEQSSGVTGGGISAVFTQPAEQCPWQANAKVPSSANPLHNQGRGIPDVAGNASPFSGYNIRVDGSAVQIGGTSAVAPLYAGLIALINSKLGTSVGYLNPTLYSLGGSAAFRDIDDGVNNENQGDPAAPSYSSGPGWDACTGWGSVDGSNLLSSLASLHASSGAQTREP